MKRTTLILLFLLSGLSVFAQSGPTMIHCGYDNIIRYYKKIDPAYATRFNAIYAHEKGNAKTTAQVFHIPVVFHVMYHNTAQNIPDSVIINEVKVLNDAYRKRHADTANVRAIFKPLSADAEIEFYLADKDPQGNASNGITRTYTTNDSWGDLIALFSDDYAWLENIKTTDSGGIDPWPTNKYLNIWVADMSDPVYGPFLMGIATPPVNPLPPNWPVGAFPPLKDGVVLQYQTVGNNNPHINDLSAFGYGTAGRTAVHEVGHYLGLRHIWGDPDPGDECTAAGDDGMGDTPAQATQSDGSTGTCPSATQNTCGSGSSDQPDMWENYMDYSRDNCQGLFTTDQVALMRSILGNQRDTLVSQQSTGILHILSAAQECVVYPQPARDEIMISCDGEIQSVAVYDMLGQQIKSWSSKQDRYLIGNIPPGNYIVIVKDKERAYNKKLTIVR